MQSLRWAPRRAIQLGALFAGLSASALSASGAITASFTPSRTSGVAPLAVTFDATGTSSTATTRPFHDIHYSWNYGDSPSATWSTNGKLKNHDTGAIGGHVFETPGVYTVTLTATDTTGASSMVSVPITVTDPNTVFSGTNTICFSTTSDFTGAPAGATKTTTTSWNTIIAALGTGKRVLLHRGQTWNHTGTQKLLTFNGPGILGAFGTGARPIVRLTSSNPDSGGGGALFFMGTGTTPGHFNDFRFMDIELDGNGFDRMWFWAEGTINNITFLRLHMHDAGPFIFLSPEKPNYYNGIGQTGHTLHSGIAVVDTHYNRIIGDGGEFNGHHIAYLGAQKFIFLGNTWNDAEDGEHVLRLPLNSKGLVAHNRLTNSRAVKHLIKLHAEQMTDLGATVSEFLTIADNYFTSALGDWYISVGPKNDISSQVVRNLVIERNHVDFASDGDTAFHLAAQETTTRNNTVILTGAGGGYVVDITRRGVEPAPQNNRIYNNSAFNGGTGAMTFVTIDPSATNTTVRNNLGKGNGTMTAISGSGSGLVQSNNSMTATPGWVVAAPTTALHFDLASTSSAINTGFAVPVFDDYEEVVRPSGAAIDRGAFEFLSTNTTPIATISVSDSSAGEPANNGQYTVTLSPAPTTNITVNLSRSGTATFNSDYNGVPASIIVGTSGTANFPLTVLDDTLTEGTETAIVSISAGTGYSIGGVSSATISITDNEAPSSNLLSHGTFEPNQATALQDMTEPYTVGSGPLNIWFGRVGSAGPQTTTYVTAGANHYLQVGDSVNTNGAMQTIVWPGSGTRQLSFKYRGSSAFVRIYGANTGNTISKFSGTNTLTLLQTITTTAASGWTTKTQSVPLSGSYSHLVIQLRAGDFDDVALAP